MRLWTVSGVMTLSGILLLNPAVADPSPAVARVDAGAAAVAAGGAVVCGACPHAVANKSATNVAGKTYLMASVLFLGDGVSTTRARRRLSVIFVFRFPPSPLLVGSSDRRPDGR